MNHFSFSLLGLLAPALFFCAGCDPETVSQRRPPDSSRAREQMGLLQRERQTRHAGKK